MNRVTGTLLLFVALLFVVCYLRESYFPQDRIEVYHHHNDKNHAKVSQAMKMTMRAKFEEVESPDYESEEIPFDFPKQKIDQYPYDENDYYDWQSDLPASSTTDTSDLDIGDLGVNTSCKLNSYFHPSAQNPISHYGTDPFPGENSLKGGLLKARNRYLALQLVKKVLRSHIKSLIHEINLLFIETQKQQRSQGPFSRICAVGNLYEEVNILRVERTFTRVSIRGHSRLFRALLEKRRNRKKMLIRIVKRKICPEQLQNLRIFKRIIRILYSLY